MLRKYAGLRLLVFPYLVFFPLTFSRIVDHPPKMFNNKNVTAMPLLEMKDVRCCNKHLDYPVPVIGTLKFYKTENWCPHCGAKYEFFDGYKYLPKEYKLLLRLCFFENISKGFLSDTEENYKYYQRPDAFLLNWSEADIAIALYNLGFRNKNKPVVDDVYYVVTDKHKIKIVKLKGELYMENETGTKHVPASQIERFDFAFLPKPEIAAELLSKAVQ